MAKYFLLPTSFVEPFKMLSRYQTAKTFEKDGRTVQAWLSKEDYLSVHTNTPSGEQFMLAVLRSRQTHKVQ